MIAEEIYKMIHSGTGECVVRVETVIQTDFFHNKIVFCKDSTGREMVAKFPSRPDMARHEYEGYQIASSAGVDVPLLMGLIMDKDGNYGLLTERIHGHNLYQ